MLRSAGVHDPHRRCWLSTQRTLAGSASPSRCAADRARGPGHQLLVATERPAPALLAGLQLGHHLGHPAPLLGGAEGGRDEDDGAPLLAVGGHRPAAPGAAPDLDGISSGTHRPLGTGTPAAAGSGQRAADPAVDREDTGRLGGRVRVGSRSGHGGTVRHRTDRAPAGRHPVGFRSHGRWTWGALSPVTRVARAAVHRPGPGVTAGRSPAAGPPAGRRPRPVPGSRTGTRRRVPT